MVAVLRPAPPAADAQRGQRDKQDAAQDVRDGHVEDEQVHLRAAAAPGQREASIVSQLLQQLEGWVAQGAEAYPDSA